MHYAETHDRLEWLMINLSIWYLVTRMNKTKYLQQQDIQLFLLISNSINETLLVNYISERNAKINGRANLTLILVM